MRRIIKYLKKKEESQYTILDNIFQYYIDGRLEELLQQNDFTDIEIYPELHKSGSLMQLRFRYYNLIVDIEFAELTYEYCISTPEISAEEFDEGFVKNKYSEDFNIENLIKNIYTMLINDKRFLY